MKINKDLIDAVMMLSFIGLVLIGTTDFSQETVKHASLGGLGLIAVLMVVLRLMAMRREDARPSYPD